MTRTLAAGAVAAPAGSALIRAADTAKGLQSTTGYDDIFMRSLVCGTTVRFTVAAGDDVPHAHAGGPALSANGRPVAVQVTCPLSAQDSDASLEVCIRDVAAGMTRLVNPSAVKRTCAPAAAGGRSYGRAISGDGQHAAFTATGADMMAEHAPARQSVYLRDMRTGARDNLALTAMGSPAAGASYASTLTSGVRVAAFGCAAADLVPFDANDLGDVFVRTPLLPAVAASASADRR